MTARRVLVVVSLAIVACSKSTPEETPPSKGPIGTRLFSDNPSPEDCKRLLLPPSGAELLCDEHVMGTGMEIHWRSYGSKDTRGTLEPPYQSGAVKCGYSLVFKPPTFEVAHGDMRLEMFQSTEKGYPTCSTSPKPEHKTVIVVSEKHDRPAQ